MSDFNSFVATLIQRTPHVDALIQRLKRKEFPTIHIDSESTHYLKSRRLYDVLLRDSYNYSDERKEELRYVFQNSENGYAGDLLVSTNLPEELDSVRFWKSAVESLGDEAQTLMESNGSDSLRISKASMLQVFRATKIASVSRMEALMKRLAAKCVLMHLSSSALSAGEDVLTEEIGAKLDQFRGALGTALLEKRDWSDKTLLHVASLTDAKSSDCIDIVLKYALEAGIKGEMLDAEDAFGNTALLLALKNKDILKSKKLIQEGSDVLLANHGGQFPLQIIHHRLPKIRMFLMEKSITFCGDISNDTFLLNVDFGVITTYINADDVSENENRLAPVKVLEAQERRKMFREKSSAHVIQMSDSIEMQNFVPTTMNRASVSSWSLSKRASLNDLLDKEGEMQGLAYLVYNDTKACSQLLQHPVTRLFLNLKWNRLRLIIYANAAFRTFFFLTYLYLTYRIYFVDCPHKNMAETSGKDAQGQVEPLNYKCSWSPVTLFLMPVVTVLTAIFIGAEMTKIPMILQVSDLRKYWLGYLGFGAWMRMLFFVIAMLTNTVPFYLFELHSSQYLIATAGVLLGAVMFLQVLGDSNLSFCFHSIYVHVYSRVLSRFLTVIATFSVIILGFAISFSIVFPQPKEFSTFARSSFRLLIMIHGEFDFEDKSVQAEGDAWVFWAGQILYVLFGSCITLVLIDVFLGYTVSDIKELKEQAEHVRRYIQIQQLYVMERFLISFKRALTKLFKIPKNRLQYSIVGRNRRRKHRSDVMVSSEELDEQLREEFREFLTPC